MEEHRRRLDFSTAHLQESTCEALCDGKLAIPSAPWSEYGAICYVPEKEILSDYSNLPRDPFRLLWYASVHGYAYVKFDRDAAEHPGLPIFRGASLGR